MRICSKCKIEKPLEEFYKNKAQRLGHAHYCKTCWTQYQKELPKLMKAERSARYYKKYVKERLQAGKDRDFWLKITALCIYSPEGYPQCECCGEQHFEFLTINHRDFSGAEHRRKEKGAEHIYRWLKANGYPKGFNVLCMNCNWADGVFGECPHEKERKAVKLWQDLKLE